MPVSLLKKIKTQIMKKTFLAIASLLVITATYSQQTAKLTHMEIKEGRKDARRASRNIVSDLTVMRFQSDFPDAKDAVYEKTNSFDEVRFLDNGIPTTAFYDWNSRLVGTTTEKTYADLPASARKYIQKHYKDYEIGQVIMFDDNEANESDMVLYGLAFSDADNYFVSLKKDNKETILKVSPEAVVSFFKEL
jgi:hypothetical protein